MVSHKSIFMKMCNTLTTSNAVHKERFNLFGASLMNRTHFRRYSETEVIQEPSNCWHWFKNCESFYQHVAGKPCIVNQHPAIGLCPCKCPRHFLLTHVNDYFFIYCLKSLTEICGASPNKRCCSFQIHCWRKDSCSKGFLGKSNKIKHSPLCYFHCWHADIEQIHQFILFSSSLPSVSSSSTFISVPITTLCSSDCHYWRKHADDERNKRLDNAERGRKNRRRKMSPAYEGGLPKSANPDQSINTAVKVFTSTEGKSFHNGFVITGIAPCVCSAWL